MLLPDVVLLEGQLNAGIVRREFDASAGQLD